MKISSPIISVYYLLLAIGPRYFLATLILFLTLNLLMPGKSHADVEIIQPLLKKEQRSFEQMKKLRYIRALVVHSKTDFFFDKAQAKGIQIAFLKQYEKFLNKGIKDRTKKIHIVYIPVNFSDILDALESGKGDIAAFFLTITPQRQKRVLFATGGAMNVNEILVRNKNAEPVKNFEALSGKTVYLVKNSSYVEHLKARNRELIAKGMQPVRIQIADDNFLSEDVMELIHTGVHQYTFVDDYKARLWSRLFQDIRLQKEVVLSAGNKIGWAVRKQNRDLQQSLNRFAQKVKKGTLLGNMFINQYYKNTQWIKNPTSEKYLKNLKKYLSLFKRYGEQYNFDYLALLAQAYQESRLDNSKKSHRGAVGIMQLLPSTAADKHVGIKNITDVEANIHAGTKYLDFLRKRYFSDPAISPLDQFAFSWAAYNAGPANVRKMRHLAKKMELDENKWFNNVEIAAGKIIGRETVDYVAHIYKYYIIYKLSPYLRQIIEQQK